MGMGGPEFSERAGHGSGANPWRTAGGGQPEVARAVLAAGAAVVAAVVLWFLAHGWSLVFDLLLGVWVGSTGVSGWKAGTVAQRVAALFRLPKLPAPLPVVIGALSCLPFAVGLLSVAVTELHHSSRADVCSALSAYQAASANDSVSDDAWFAALRNVGNTAADYSGFDQDSVVASGKAALRLANGSGDSYVVMTSVGQADAALGPVMEFCNGNE